MMSLPMHYWSMICLAVAVMFLILELFVPSAGVFGLVAALLILASLVAGFWYHLAFGAGLLLVIVVATPFFIAFAVKIWPHTPIGKRILIGDRSEDTVLPKGSHYTNISNQAGRTGVAKTKMYPSGIVLIDGEPFDAVSNGFPIDQGEPIRVVSVQGNRLQVQKIEDDEVLSEPSSSPEDSTSPDDALTQTMEDLGIEDFELGESGTSEQ